jgi:hypothetical protein
MKDSITLGLAILGSLLSSILFVIKIIELKRDSASLWIRARWGSRIISNNKSVSRGLSFRIVNSGRRVAYIREVRIKLQYKNDIFNSNDNSTSIGNDTFWFHDVFDGDPIALGEGQQKHFSAFLQLSDQRNFEENSYAEVITTVGRRYRSKIVDLFEDDDLGHDSFV